ncbi:hypothetical protein [Proteus sp. NMG38-2]|uniref:hypothetical protein n=1 Tax=Proteus sp. NMG38-2 TaxID=2883107 RepID=UPI001D0A1691|nr:hypothetical protein [Proteus sp. NMG38-2]UDN34505.1 hypothetical protein LG402_12100 [Proteus sp. NMG38-2]
MTILIYIFCVFLFLCLFIVPKNKEKLRPFKKYLFNKFTLNENSLHKQGLFWFAILFPLYSSLCFIFLLGWDYPFKWDAIGFNNFLNIHKFSLGILALSPILGAFVVSTHRSIQTAKQIEVTEKKNKVDIYHTIKKNIIDELNNYTNKDFIFSVSAYDLYAKGYLKDNNFEMKVNTMYLEKIEKKIQEIVNLKSILKKDKIKTYNSIANKKIKVYSEEIFIAVVTINNILTDSIPTINLKFKKYNSNDLKEKRGYYNDMIKKVKITDNTDNETKNNMIYNIIENGEYSHKIVGDIEDENKKIKNLIDYIDSSIISLCEFITDFLLILYPQIDANKFIPSLDKLVYMNGDKVATENQNNHE